VDGSYRMEDDVEDTGTFRVTITLLLKLIGMRCERFVDLAIADPVELEYFLG